MVWPFLTVALRSRRRGSRQRRRARRRRSRSRSPPPRRRSWRSSSCRATDPSRVYYGTDTRLADLAVGATLAWLTATSAPRRRRGSRRSLRVRAPFALVGPARADGDRRARRGDPVDFMFQGGFLVACRPLRARDRRRPTATLAAHERLRLRAGRGGRDRQLRHLPVALARHRVPHPAEHGPLGCARCSSGGSGSSRPSWSRATSSSSSRSRRQRIPIACAHGSSTRSAWR